MREDKVHGRAVCGNITPRIMGEVHTRPKGELESVLEIDERHGALLEFLPNDSLRHRTRLTKCVSCISRSD
jgi:hypothetical protein